MMIISKTIRISIYAFLLSLLVTNINTAIADDSQLDQNSNLPQKTSNETCKKGTCQLKNEKKHATTQTADMNLMIPFKCNDEKCGEVIYFTLDQLKNSTQPVSSTNCPKCKKNTLTPAFECPKCRCVFIIKKDPATGGLDDKCPKCYTNYFKARQEEVQKLITPTTKPAIDWNKKIPFKCSDEKCGEVIYYTLGQLRDMQKTATMGPMMGPSVLECPKCKKHTLTQAVECPKCKNIFIMKMDPAAGLFDDKCSKCGTSYSKAWQEKFRKSQEKGAATQPSKKHK